MGNTRDKKEEGVNVEAFVRSETTDALHLREWEERYPDLVVGFTLRTSGFGSSPFSSNNMGLHVGDDPDVVVKNRRQLSNRLGFEFDVWTSADQVHGKQVYQITRENCGAGREKQEDSIPCTDGIFTNQSDILLTSFYADCVPLFFIDPIHRVIGLAHAGWKGTVGNIAKEMIHTFESKFGSKAEDILTAIGPSIQGCCYEVDEHVMKQVRENVPSWEECVVPSKNSDRYMLDLPASNQRIMENAGILPQHIVRTSWCTNCRTDLFFSHRKEAGNTGRMASFIGWKRQGRE